MSATPLAALLACSPGEPAVATAPVHPTRTAVYEAGTAALAAEGIATLRWSLTPYLAPDKVAERHRPLIEFVAKRLGVAYDIQLGRDYSSVVDAIALGQADVAILSPYTYVQAVNLNPGVRVLASHVARGAPTYGSYIVASADGPVHSMEDLRGRQIAFVDTRSTSGWLFPAAVLLNSGINPLEDIEPVFLGNHDLVVDAVVEGRVDAAGTYEEAISDARRRRPDVDLRIIAKGPRVPFDAYAARPGLPEAAAHAIQTALAEVTLRTQEGREILAPMDRINGIMPVDDSHYDIIREVEKQVVDTLGPRETWLTSPSDRAPVVKASAPHDTLPTL